MSSINKIRVIIIDDDSDAIKQLNKLLTTYHPEIVIAGEFDHPDLAFPMIEAGQVDGVFLDIMYDFVKDGKTLGFDAAKRINLLPRPRRPWIIFITADDENAKIAIKFRPYDFIVRACSVNHHPKFHSRLSAIFPRESEMNCCQI
jgi:DNA-binding LytR/AlgR family response regulator